MGQRSSRNFYNINIKTIRDQPGCPSGWSSGRTSPFFCNQKEQSTETPLPCGRCLPALSSEGVLMKGTAFGQDSSQPLWRGACLEKEGINWDGSDFERLPTSPQSHSHRVICQLDAERGWVTSLLKTLGTANPQRLQRTDERKRGLHYEGGLTWLPVLPAAGAEEGGQLFALGSLIICSSNDVPEWSLASSPLKWAIPAPCSWLPDFVDKRNDLEGWNERPWALEGNYLVKQNSNSSLHI